MEKNRILELESRRRIFKYIKRYPGLCRSEISEKLNTPYTTLKYHLNYLKKRGLIEEKHEDKYVRCYTSKSIGERNKRLLQLMRQKMPRRIILYLSFFHESSLKDLADYWKKNPRTMYFHLRKLVKVGLIERIPSGREIKFRLYPQWEGEMFDLLVIYEKRFFDDVVDEYIEYFDVQVSLDRIIKVVFEIFPHPYHA